MEKLREGGFLISKVHQLMNRIFAKLLKEFKIEELNPAQGRIMFPLWRQDNISFQDLLKGTQLSKAILSKMLNNLEEIGYIKRIPSQDDKRTISIQVKEKGKTLQAKYIDVSTEMTNIFYKKFTNMER